MIMVVVAIINLTGCERKGSREWIENKVADIEKVYPTENLEDLFEKFPNGFVVIQNRIYKEEGKSYSIDLEMKGDVTTKQIRGSVKKVLIKAEPYKEIIQEESRVEYKQGEGLVLAKKELTRELLPKNYFLFQRLELNKEIIKKLDMLTKNYSFETARYEITYKYQNKKLEDYFNLENTEVKLEITGQDHKNNYFHTIEVENKEKNLSFYEKIVEGENR